MIIFDLDGTLADCEHRRHFVDPRKNQDYEEVVNPGYMQISEGWFHKNEMLLSNPPKRKKFIPNWKAFFEACDEDERIDQTFIVIGCLFGWDYYDNDEDVHIWSGRCESVRDKTEKWLNDNNIAYNSLKMRPIGDSTPDDVLKERWLDDHIAGGGNPISFVVDDRPKVVRMWRRRGIFVFDVNQSGKEF